MITLTRPAASLRLTARLSATRALVRRTRRHRRLVIALRAVDGAGNATALTLRLRAG